MTILAKKTVFYWRMMNIMVITFSELKEKSKICLCHVINTAH